MCTGVLPEDLLDVLRRGALTEEQARLICAQGQEAVVFALLLSNRSAEQRAKIAAESHQTPIRPLPALCSRAGQSGGWA